MFFSFSKQLVFFPPLFTTMTSSARAEGLCPTNPLARHFRYSSAQIWARYKRLWCRRWHTFVISFKSGQCSWSVRKKKTISGNVASSNSSSPDFIQHVVRCRNSSALQVANYIRKRTDFGFFLFSRRSGFQSCHVALGGLVTQTALTLCHKHMNQTSGDKQAHGNAVTVKKNKAKHDNKSDASWHMVVLWNVVRLH